MTGGLVRTDDAIMSAKGPGLSDSSQFAPTSREFSGYHRSIAKYQTHRKQARQEPDPQNTREQRSADRDDRIRDHVRHPDQWIISGLWRSII